MDPGDKDIGQGSMKKVDTSFEVELRLLSCDFAHEPPAHAGDRASTVASARAVRAQVALREVGVLLRGG